MTVQELRDKLNQDLQSASDTYNEETLEINATLEKITEYESLKSLAQRLREEWYAIYDSETVLKISDATKKYVFYSTGINGKFNQVEVTSYTEENTRSHIENLKFIPDCEDSVYLKLLEPEIRICMLNMRYDLIVTYESRIEELRVELGIDPDNESTVESPKGKTSRKQSNNSIIKML